MNSLQHLTTAVAERDEILRQAEKLAARRAALAPAAAALADAQARFDAVGRADHEKNATWARSGAKGPPPGINIKARDGALHDLAIASEAARGADAVLAEIDAEHLRLAATLSAAQANVRSARGRHYAALLKVETARLREIEDARRVQEAILAGLHQQAFASDAYEAGTVTSLLEQERVAWLTEREATLSKALAERWSALTADIPN